MQTWIDSTESGQPGKPKIYNKPNWYGGNNAACFTGVHDVKIVGGHAGPCGRGTPGSDMHALQFIHSKRIVIDGIELEANGGDALNLYDVQDATVQRLTKVTGTFFKNKRDIGQPGVIDLLCMNVTFYQCSLKCLVVAGGGGHKLTSSVFGILQLGVEGYGQPRDVQLTDVQADELFIDPACGKITADHKSCTFKRITGRQPVWI